jgi:hypothetical protein
MSLALGQPSPPTSTPPPHTHTHTQTTFVPAVPLGVYLHRHSATLSLKARCTIAAQLCDLLDFAWQRGVTLCGSVNVSEILGDEALLCLCEATPVVPDPTPLQVNTILVQENGAGVPIPKVVLVVYPPEPRSRPSSSNMVALTVGRAVFPQLLPRPCWSGVGGAGFLEGVFSAIGTPSLGPLRDATAADFGRAFGSAVCDLPV